MALARLEDFEVSQAWLQLLNGFEGYLGQRADKNKRRTLPTLVSAGTKLQEHNILLTIFKFSFIFYVKTRKNEQYTEFFSSGDQMRLRPAKANTHICVLKFSASRKVPGVADSSSMLRCGLAVGFLNAYGALWL